MLCRSTLHCSSSLLLLFSLLIALVSVLFLFPLSHNSLCSSPSLVLLSCSDWFSQSGAPQMFLIPERLHLAQGGRKSPQVTYSPPLNLSFRSACFDMPMKNIWWQLGDQGAMSAVNVTHPQFRNISLLPVTP